MEDLSNGEIFIGYPRFCCNCLSETTIGGMTHQGVNCPDCLPKKNRGLWLTEAGWRLKLMDEQSNFYKLGRNICVDQTSRTLVHAGTWDGNRFYFISHE